MENLKLWDAVKRPPKTALKQIQGGRLSGKTDISPQWRYLAATGQFGPCGIGWKYTIDRLWAESGADGEVMSFALVTLYVKVGDQWSEGIPGIGGAMQIEAEKKGLHTSDECYKMAVTDALSVAFKVLGFGADIYMGMFDGSKYLDEKAQKESPADEMTVAQKKKISELSHHQALTDEQVEKAVAWLKDKHTRDAGDKMITAMEAMIARQTKPQGSDRVDMLINAYAEAIKCDLEYAMKRLNEIMLKRFDVGLNQADDALIGSCIAEIDRDGDLLPF